MTDSPYAYVDHARLVSDLKEGNEAAITHLYRTVCSGQMGRLFLTHQLAEAGVGSPRPTDMAPIQRADHDGAARHALHILNLAGFGPMSAAHAITADLLEGQDNDGRSTSGGFSGPDGNHGYDGGDLGPD